MIATPIKIQVTDEARAHMAAKGLDCDFQAVIDLTEDVFRDASQITIELHIDPDVAGLQWVVVDVVVPWETFDPVPPARDEWYRRFRAAVPQSVFDEFGLNVWRRPE